MLNQEDLDWINKYIYEQLGSVYIFQVLDEEIEKANKYNSLLINQKGGVINEMSNHFGLYGYVGQSIFKRLLEVKEIEFKESPYFNENIKRDDYDFLINGYKIDIKSSPYNKEKELPYLIRDDKKDKDKKIDIYFMVRIDFLNKLSYIKGAISYKRFWTISKQFQGNFKERCHFVIQSDLISFDEFIYFINRKK